MSPEAPPPPSAWADAVLAAELFAVDPAAAGGVVLRALPGPPRDRWLALLRAALPPSAPLRRVPVHAGDARLLGGLDLAATLRSGRPVAARGILADADGGVLLLATAERLEAARAARLVYVLDSGEVVLEREGLAQRCESRFGVVALDEGLGPDEGVPGCLAERLAFHLDLGPVALGEIDAAAVDVDAVARARLEVGEVVADEEVVRSLCEAAMALGIHSLRAPLLALRAARAAAALAGRRAVTAEDAATAARLVLAPRATCLPVPETAVETEAEPEGPDEASGEAREPRPADGGDEAAGDGSLTEWVLETAAAAIPAGLLERLRGAPPTRARSPAAGGAGVRRRAIRRGRPCGVERGQPAGGARLHVVETLRVAAPWQRIRRREVALRDAARERPARVEVRPDDFRVRRLRERSETTVIFAVDASGSSALHRLAEAKGAVERLLADCYVRRDQVALVAFRQQGAEVLLPPTRSLVRAKRCLAALPGGGGTPLAAGLEAAASLARSVERRGGTPLLVLLTDGRANVARDGTPGRAAAEQDALATARALRAEAAAALLLDTSPRPQEIAARLARELGATYLPLPHADSAALHRAVRSAVAS